MILLKNCPFIITQNQGREILKNKDVLIEEDKISEIGENLDKSGEIIDCKNKVVLPGLINTHTHLAMTLLRGYADDLELQTWLQEKIWPLEAKLTADDCYIGSLLGCLEMIKSGTTCFNDMYYYPNKTAQAIIKSGIRGCPGDVLFDFHQKENLEKELRKAHSNLKLIGKNSRVKPFLAPHAIYTCSEELLKKVKELANKYNIKIHIHLSETKKEVKDSKKQFGGTPVEYLNRINFLGPEIIAPHCVWLTNSDIQIMKKNNISTSHCPTSNMKLVSGVSPIMKLIQNNVLVSIGTDSVCSNNNLDMFKEMKLTALLQKLYNLDPIALSAQKALDLATISGAKALGIPNLGSIERNKIANLILIDINKPHLIPYHNIVSNLVYSASGSDIDTVIVDGKIIMENRTVSNLDEEKIIKDSLVITENLINR